MNIFKLLRKPYLSILMASLILFVSCEQYELNLSEKSIDYSLFEEFKNTEIDLSFLPKGNVSNYDLSLAIEQEINKLFNISLDLPEEWHQSIGLPSEQFLQKSKEYGWIDAKEEQFILEFSNEIKANGSSAAISTYETKILNMNLSQEEFDKKTFFLNAMKSFEYLGFFDKNLKSNPCWDAILMMAVVSNLYMFCLNHPCYIRTILLISTIFYAIGVCAQE